MSKGKALLSIFLVLTLQSAAAGAQQLYCHEPTMCWAYPSPLGLQCSATPSAIPCSAPTPVPAATPTPKPEVQPAYTTTPLFSGSDVGYSYLQWMSMQDGIVWGNGGICCPGLPDPSKPPGGDPNNSIGECIFAVDYNVTPPRFKELWCTSRDSSQLWESGLAQVASSDTYKYVVAGVRTYRPATGALQGGWKDGELWGFGTNEIAGVGWQKARGAGTIFHMTGWVLFPQGILDLGGARWLYANTLYKDGGGGLVRFYWPNAWQIAFWDPTTNLSSTNPGGSGIVIDADGSLITADSDWSGGHIYTSKTVRLWRSKDEGRTWTNTGIHFDARPGKTLFGCGFAHRPGGAALQPLHLICTEGTGKGPDAIPSDWNAVSVRVTGAAVPSNFGQKPVFRP